MLCNAITPRRHTPPVKAVVSILQSQLNVSVRMQVQFANNVFTKCSKLARFYFNAVTLQKHSVIHNDRLIPQCSVITFYDNLSVFSLFIY